MRQRFLAESGHPEFGPLPANIIRELISTNRSLASVMRSLAPLPQDAQKLIDQTVIRVGLDRLTVVADLLAEGLTFPLADPLSVMEVTWDMIAESGGAQRTMNPEARGENQLPNRLPGRIPIYLTTDDFFLGIRTLRASQRVGQPLDTSGIEQATRRVNEAIEDACINGVPFTVGGGSAPGLLNAPNLNSFTFATNLAWDAPTKTGDLVLADVLGMIDLAAADRRFGPFNLYVNTTYSTALNRDFKSATSGTTRARLEEIVTGGRALRIRTADLMPANFVALVQMTSDVIDVIDGQQPVTIPWTSPSGMTLFWLVMAIMIPRVKTDFSARSGIVVGHT